MNRLNYFTAFFVMGLLALFAAFISPNGWTWILCIAALPTMVWACGGKKAPPVLLFILALAWLQIAALVALADLKGLRFDQMEFGPYLERATVYALVAVLTIAVGMRFGGRVGDLIFARSGSSSVQVLHVDPRTDLSRLFIGYAACAAVTGTLAQLAASFAGIAQAILALGALRYAFVYLIAAAVLRFGVGYPWLIAVTVLEIATGILGFFSGFKEVIYIILIAAATVRRSLDVRIWVFGAIAGGLIIWMSLVWSVIKFDYRAVMADMTTSERAGYIFEKYADGVDYDEALERLLERVQYTMYFANVLAYDDAGLLTVASDYYSGALQHVSMPRILFPNKPSLSDSNKTSELLGININEETSIGIGFVAEAYVDFGFPGMLLPMFIIGIAHGLGVTYFMTRRAPILVREGLAVAAFFLTFSIATNIDKALGGLLTNWIVLGIALRFGYPLIGPWFFQTALRQSVLALGRRPGAGQ